MHASIAGTEAIVPTEWSSPHWDRQVSTPAHEARQVSYARQATLLPHALACAQHF